MRKRQDTSNLLFEGVSDLSLCVVIHRSFPGEFSDFRTGFAFAEDYHILLFRNDTNIPEMMLLKELPEKMTPISAPKNAEMGVFIDTFGFAQLPVDVIKSS